MEAMDLLLTRRSCPATSMCPPGPDEAQLEQILTAGLRTPDHGRLHPWCIQVIDDRPLLGDLLERVFGVDHPDASPEALATERSRAERSPVLLIVSSRIDPDSRIPVMEQLLSGGAVCQNLLNGAHASGFVAQWVTAWPAYHPDVKVALGVPEGDHILGWIHVGSATGVPRERERASIDDVVLRWGGPHVTSP